MLLSDPILSPPQMGGLLAQARSQALGGNWRAARDSLETALLSPLAAPAESRSARYLLWEACQVLREPEAAVAHLRALVREHPVTLRPAPAGRTLPQPRRRVLALALVGDFQANLPLEPLLDPALTQLTTLWIDGADPHPLLSEPERLRRSLPPFDILWIAMAEDERAGAALALADRLARALGGPVINDGARIGALTRGGVAGLLAGLPDAVIPPVARLQRAALADGAPPFRYPLILRPQHSHAGAGLTRLEGPADLAQALAAQPSVPTFLISPYVDYAGADGLFGKARIIFVEGRPYPFHYALHDDWRVWYYNARMELDAGKRAREAAFLADLPGCFGPRAMAALEGIARRVGLDYFGLDCAVLPDGRLLVFEVETGMIVHDRDDPVLYPAKARYVPRIFRAVEAMLDRRLRAARAGGAGMAYGTA